MNIASSEVLQMRTAGRVLRCQVGMEEKSVIDRAGAFYWDLTKYVGCFCKILSKFTLNLQAWGFNL